MATQPNIDLVPTIPPPQTCAGVLNQIATRTSTTGVLPGEVPIKDIHMARAIVIGAFTVTADDAVGQAYVINGNAQTVTNSTFPLAFLQASTELRVIVPAYPWEFYFNQTQYYNADVILTFWAIKPPAAVGRLRFTMKPPSYFIQPDESQREITKEWDLQASNIFQITIPNYNMREFKNCVAKYAALNGVADTRFDVAISDFKSSQVFINLTHVYQPGSIFPQSFKIYCFQSFKNAQFRTVLGPAVPIERTTLTDRPQIL